MKKKKQYSLIITMAALAFVGAACSPSSLRGNGTGGVFKTENSGQDFKQIVKIDDRQNISSVSILDLAISENDPNVIYAGTAANGLFKSTNGGETWTQLFSGSTVNSLVLEKGSNDVVYAAITVNGRGKIFKTTDGGTNWKDVYSEAKSKVDVLTLAMDNSSSIIYAGDSQGVLFKSSDAGESWSVIHRPEQPISFIKTSRTNPSRLYYASESSLLTSSDGGSTFQVLEFKFPERKSNITSLAIDPQNDNIIYLGSERSIVKSVDGGKTFTSVNILNPTGPAIRSINIDPNNGSRWFYGSGSSFYKTVDSGANWSVTQLNSNRAISVIRPNPASPEVMYIGTVSVEKK